MPKPILHTALFHLPQNLSFLLAHSDGNLHLAGAHHSGALFVKFYSKAILLRLIWNSLSLSKKLAVASPVFLLPLLVFLTLFLIPKQTSLSYASQNCFSNPVVLPNAVSQLPASSYSLKMNPKFTVNGYPLLSTTSCLVLNDMPAENSIQNIKLKSLGFINSNVKISTPSLPALTLSSDISAPISPLDGVEFSLNKHDKTFNYKISANSKEDDCTVNGLEVTCPLENFNLDQGAKYQIAVKRQFKYNYHEVLSQAITLRDPVIFTGSSIENGQIVYDKPSEITFDTNKKLSDVGEVSAVIDGENLDVIAEISETGLVVNFSNELPREKEITVTVKNTVAEDGAYLPEPYVIKFNTSGGPKVVSASIGSYDVSPSHTIVLKFDSALLAEQSLQQYITLSAGSGPVESSIYASGNSVFINPTNSLGACMNFTVSIKNGLSNSFGVSGVSAWSKASRTTCKQVFSVGSSVQGRALTAYRFGSGATKIVFVGGMHGSERSSYRTLIAFVDELERKYNEIPADKTVIVIPDINPDGYAHASRTNANNVDLNRNFPSNDWQTGVYMPGGVFLENGGGSAPLDQPESSALASYINTVAPRLVLTYHAVARSVISNGAGDSHALASSYAVNSGFAHYTSAQEDGLFNYPTTGEFETWLADKKSIPTLLVELATMSGNELSSQRSAMWAMLGI